MDSNEQHLDKALQEEFSSHKETIHSLKMSNNHFKKLMVNNHALWEQIQNIQNEVSPADDATLETLEKKRLLILDEIAKMIGDFQP